MSKRESVAVHIPSGDPDTMNVADLMHEGDLGAEFPFRDREYQVVTLSATSDVVPAAKQVLLWKDLATYEVTNDVSESLGRNYPAGILRNAATRGSKVCALRRGKSIPVNIASASPAVGDKLVANSVDGEGLRIAAGTAPTYLLIGVIAKAGTTVTETDIDVDIEFRNP